MVILFTMCIMPQRGWHPRSIQTQSFHPSAELLAQIMIGSEWFSILLRLYVDWLEWNTQSLQSLQITGRSLKSFSDIPFGTHIFISTQTTCCLVCIFHRVLSLYASHTTIITFPLTRCSVGVMLIILEWLWAPNRTQLTLYNAGNIEVAIRNIYRGHPGR